MRVPVISVDDKPLMPTKPSRARRWIKEGKAIGKINKLGIFYVQLTTEPSDTQTQDIVIGLDPGKMFSGVAVQTKKYTLQMFHLVLPFKTVKDRMEQRAMMRRGRRGRRINRKLSFSKRSHRQARFDNRRGSKLPPSIRANKDLEYRTITLLCEIYPVKTIVIEEVEARGSKSFSPVMVGQRYQINRLSELANVKLKKGWETSTLRKHLGLHKEKSELAVTTQKYQFKGENAYASFYQYDGCNSTYVDIYAYNSITKDAPGAPTSQKQASLYYSNYNYCDGTGSSGYGSVTNPNFTVDKQLNSGSLNGTFTVYDYSSGTEKSVNVALTWTCD